MQSCWYNPESRITVSQIELMMTDLMQVFEHTKMPSDLNSDIYEGEPISLEDFDARWNALKPNLLLMRDADMLERNQPNNNKQDHTQKSASLNNLHGSLDNLLDNRQFDPMESWLENVASDTSDMSFVRGLSEAITDLDNAIAMQNMSSSPEFGKIKVTVGGHFTSSESETEDENWRKKIERGAYTEKVRQKSRSVADLMVLTHIDCSESDSETLPSLDYSKANQRVRYLKSVDNQKKFGSEGNLFHVHDNAFQEELKKLQEERRDSLLFVPDKFSECSFSEEREAATTSAFTPSSLSNNRLNSLENSPVKKLMEKLNSPSEMVPPQQVYNVFNVRVQHINVGGTVCDKVGETVDRSVISSDIVNKEETAFSTICDRQIEKKVLEQNTLITNNASDNQNDLFSVASIKNQKLEHHESPNHIKIVYNPFKNVEHFSGSLFEGCIKKIDEQNIAFSKTENIFKNTDTYPCKNVDSGIATTYNAINSTNQRNEIISSCLKDFSEDKIGKDNDLNDSLPKKQKNFEVKIEILNEQSFTPNVHRNYDMPNILNNDISSKEILVTSKENSKNVKLKVPKLSEIIQRNAIDYKVHHHHSGTNDKTSVIPKSEENEKLLHQEVVDKDSGLNTPENSASLEKLYDDNEEILDIGSFDSDRSNETNTNKGVLLTELSNEEEHSNKEKADEDCKEIDREEEISKMIDFCVKNEAKLMCDLFLAHERSNCFSYAEDKFLVDNSKTIEIDNSTNNISNLIGTYSFLNYKVDMENFIQAEIYHSSNLLERTDIFVERNNHKTLHLLNLQLNNVECKYSSSSIEVINQELPITKLETNESIKSSTGCKQMHLNKELCSFPSIVSEDVIEVPDENESTKFVINNFVNEDIKIFPSIKSESPKSIKKLPGVDVVLDKTDNTELFIESSQNLNNSQTQMISSDSLEGYLDGDSLAKIKAHENEEIISNERKNISTQVIDDKTVTQICKQQCEGDNKKIIEVVELEIKDEPVIFQNLVLQTKTTEGENENIFALTKMENCESSVAVDYKINNDNVSVPYTFNATLENEIESSNTFFVMETNKPNILDVTKSFICNEIENQLHYDSQIMQITEKPNNVAENQILAENNLSNIGLQDVLDDNKAQPNIYNYDSTDIVRETALTFNIHNKKMENEGDSPVSHDSQPSSSISNELMYCRVDADTSKAAKELCSTGNEPLNIVHTELNSNILSISDDFTHNDITPKIVADDEVVSGDIQLLAELQINNMVENEDQVIDTTPNIECLNANQEVIKIFKENNEHHSVETVKPTQIETPNGTVQSVELDPARLFDEVHQEDSKLLNIKTNIFVEEDLYNQNSSIQQTAMFLNNEIKNYSTKTTEEIDQNIESTQPLYFKEKLVDENQILDKFQPLDLSENQSPDKIKEIVLETCDEKLQSVQKLENTKFSESTSVDSLFADTQYEILNQNDIQPGNSNKIPSYPEESGEQSKHVENLNSNQLQFQISMTDADDELNKQNADSEIERTSIFINNEIESYVSERTLFKTKLQGYSNENNGTNTPQGNLQDKYSNIPLTIKNKQLPKDSTELEKTVDSENITKNLLSLTSTFLENEIKMNMDLKRHLSNMQTIPQNLMIEEIIPNTSQNSQNEENKDDKDSSRIDVEEDGLTKFAIANNKIVVDNQKIIDTNNEILETSTFLKNEIENYVGSERRIDFDLSDTQEKMSLNSLTHISTFTSTPFASRRPNDSTVILGASDDYSIDYYSGLKTSVDPEEGADLQFSSNFVRPNNTHDLYSLETWDNFLGRSFDEQENAAIDFNDFSQEPHSLLFLECDDQINETNELKMTKVLNETYDIAASKVLNETYDVAAAPETSINGTFSQEKNEDINETFNVKVDKTSDQIEAGKYFFVKIKIYLSPVFLIDPLKNTVNNGNSSGWFLHPQAISKDIPIKTQETPSTSAPDESYVGFSMDDEIMAAIRNELLTKLPHAQRASSDHQIEENGEEMDSAERNEVFLRYNVYNTPLSPIPEESYDSEGGSGRITPKR